MGVLPLLLIGSASSRVSAIASAVPTPRSSPTLRAPVIYTGFMSVFIDNSAANDHPHACASICEIWVGRRRLISLSLLPFPSQGEGFPLFPLPHIPTATPIRAGKLEVQYLSTVNIPLVITLGSSTRAGVRLVAEAGGGGAAVARCACFEAEAHSSRAARRRSELEAVAEAARAWSAMSRRARRSDLTT